MIWEMIAVAYVVTLPITLPLVLVILRVAGLVSRDEE
jgi:cytochrome c oxidase subunit IV